MSDKASAATRPNIIFILLDDLGWRDLQCYGSSFYETPCLDRLAGEGLRFTDAYAAAPVCSPTRASILSGKYPATVGVTQFIGGHTVGRLCDVPYFAQLPMSEISLATTLRDHGYRTWHVGKWHLGGPNCWPPRHGFDVNIAGCEWGHPRHGFFSPYHCPTLPDGPEGEYLTDRLTDEAIALLRSGENDRPFFLNFWHYAVHTPIQAPAALVEKYKRKAKELGLDQIEAIDDGEFFPVEHKKHLRVRRRKLQSDPVYAAMIENLDWNVGRLMQALEETGQAENTIVIFTSDNGGVSTEDEPPTCNAPLAEGKGWMYEGGNREPLLVRWPGVITPGKTTDAVVTSPDFYPTLLEAAGLPPLNRQHVDGKSFLPVLHGQPFARGPIFWHYPHYSNQGSTPGCAMREGDWKLIHFFEDDRRELYNLKDDLSESVDLAAREPAILRELSAKLDAWVKSVEGLIPKPNPNWQPAHPLKPADLV